MFKAVIFDFDLTLVDSLKAVTLGLNKMAEHFALPKVNENEIKKAMSSEAEHFWRNIWGYQDDKWNDFFLKEIAGQEKYHLTLEPKAEELLIDLKNSNKNLGLATNRHDGWGALVSVGLAKYFDAAVGCGEVAKGKPAPDMLYLIIDKLKVGPSESLFIGDSTSDMQAASNAGIRAIGLLTGGWSKEELFKAGAWQVRENLKDLKNIFNSQN